MIGIDEQAVVVLGELILRAGLGLLIRLLDPADAQGGKQGCRKLFKHLSLFVLLVCFCLFG